ncbi:MAG TPA: hypothetical protein VEA15_01690 [Caulobacteraceae bacterium]|nr:hypothetical protein [Caulobacteraceae bacterium]
MRPAIVAFAAAAVLAPAAIAVAAEAWSVQTFRSAGFSIEAPTQLTAQPAAQVEGAGTMLAFSGTLDGLAYVATSTNVANLPGIREAAPADVAQAVMDGALEGNTLVSQRPSPYPAGAARDFIVRSPDGKMLRNRVVFHYPWVYSIMVGVQAGNAAALDSPAADRYLNSIKPAN